MNNQPLGRFSSTMPISHVTRHSDRPKVSVRFALRSPKKGMGYSNPHPLEVWITVDKERIHFGAVWENERVEIDPNQWRVSAQRSARTNSLVNKQILSIRDFLEDIHAEQLKVGRPTIKSVRFHYENGYSPEWSNTHGWVYPEDKAKRQTTGQYSNCISYNSPLDEAYNAYVAHLRHKEGTSGALSDITLGRWERGLLLLKEFAVKTEKPLPVAGAVTIGWAKRFHSWLQTQDGGRHRPQPISEGQASRFVLKVSNVLTWMIEEDWIASNPISNVKWPKHQDKEVQFLEPEHVNHLLELKWEGTKGVALWWFSLMCCTGMDYPDAVAYAKNRKAFEVMGSEGRKIVGKRKKPPHNEYHLPLLNEVETLFAKYPSGPAGVTSNCVNHYTDLIEQELGIDWRITAKTARKTFGCLMLAAGHRIADVSLMLGHSTIVTTERHYVKVRGTAIDRSMERVKVSIKNLAGVEREEGGRNA